MPVSFSGLDLSFLKDPANRLPPAPPKKRVRHVSKRSDVVAAPYFVGDIQPFVNVANNEKTHWISSRSELRAFERDFKCVQVGNDFKPGEIAAKNEKKRADLETLAATFDTPSGWGEL